MVPVIGPIVLINFKRGEAALVWAGFIQVELDEYFWDLEASKHFETPQLSRAREADD
jgi:hypothetical protein